MKYDVKKWVLEASKDDLVAAANHHSISNGITNPYQLRRMLLDKFEWHNLHTDKQASARFISTCIGKMSYPSEQDSLGWVVTRELEHAVLVGLNENFKWQGLDTMIRDAKKEQKERAQRALDAGRAERARNEERLGEALVEEASLAAPQKSSGVIQKVIGAQTGPRMVEVVTTYDQGGLMIEVRRDDGTSYEMRGEEVEEWLNSRSPSSIMNGRQTAFLSTAPDAGQEFWEFVGMADSDQAARFGMAPDTVVTGSLKIDAGGAIYLKGVGPLTVAAPQPSFSMAFRPVEPNPDSLEELSLEDILGLYATVEQRKKGLAEEVSRMHVNGEWAAGLRDIATANLATAAEKMETMLEHIERRFEKQGWLISRIKGR